ncbi:CBO0543 family protein [Neobacillus cucumis]|uniref:CBO0543 family protein n=1 Tax=Neobacillus cucumis TaxID=1740721 RepID=UPI002E1FB9A9|nr:hypothetical protein [Neobacillus cucumis]
MKVDQLIIYILYSCTFISLAFIPKEKLRDASIIFLFQQAVTWFAGILAVGLNLVEYPVRELAKVNGTSFLYEFFLFPVVTIFFCIYYPRASKRWKNLYIQVHLAQDSLCLKLLLFILPISLNT